MDMSPKRKRSSSISTYEPLEARALPSAIGLGVIAETISDSEPNDTADRAQDLGSAAAVVVDGSISRNGVDVDWFSFTLQVPSSVTLTMTQGTLSLFNDATGDFGDPLTFGGLRLLQQGTSSGLGVVTLQRDLAAGTYLVATSGAGNYYFQPFVADSGLAGAAGAYSLTFTNTPVSLNPGNPSSLLEVTATPLNVRLSLAAALPYVPTVELLDANGAIISVASIHQHVGLSEVQVIPSSPLVPGGYTAVLKDADGNIQLTEDFTVLATLTSETGLGGNDTAATSVDLGVIGNSNLIQVAGAIGDDPFYQLVSSQLPNYAGNDVDLYHFQITSTEAVGLRAEVFAGRIGSPLDAGLSLYRLEPATGNLEFVVGLNQSYNMTPGTNVPIPFYYDPAITAGLTAGDYYIAVSHGSTATSPLERQIPGFVDGLFDPNVPHSGSAGWGIGEYVLNLQVVSIPDPPEVLASSISQEQELTSSPTEIRVKFSEFINLTALAFDAFQATSQSTISGIFISDANGDKIFPRLTAFDPDDLEAHFLLLDRLAAGNYELHLSGRMGLMNVVGAPLVGNSPDGDYVVKFTVDTDDAGTAGNPLVWTHQFESEPATSPQDLGVLFPHEFEAGVGIVRTQARDAKHARDTSDEYQFSILQTQSYFFTLQGDRLPRGVTLGLFDQSGNAISAAMAEDGLSLTTQLSPGVYVLRVGDWGVGAAKSLDYRIEAYMQGNSDNAPPLWSGPAPAVGIRLAAAASNPPGVPPVGGGQPGTNPGVPSGATPGGSVSDSGSSGSVSTANPIRPAYLSDRSGLSLINVPDGAGNIVIAIPTVTSTGVGGAVLRANRVANGRLSDRANASPGGLSDLADGLVGKSGTTERARDRKLTAGRKLGDLIDSALASTKEETSDDNHVAGENKAKPRSEDKVEEDVVSVEQQKVDGESVRTNSANEEQNDKARPRDVSELQKRRLMEILSLGLPESENSVVAVVTVDADTAASALKEFDLPRALKYSDKVFAGGLGLLLSALATQRSSDSELIRSVHRKGKRAEGRWCPSRQPGMREEAVS